MANTSFRNKKANADRSNNGIRKRVSGGGKVIKKKVVGDARQKIIQKKRNTVTDARDILASMAKGKDARSKLVRLRQKVNGNDNHNVQVIGHNILKKTDRNGKISLVTNKNRMPSTMNTKIQQQLGLLTAPRASRPIKKMAKRPTKEFQPPVLKKTIRNDYSMPMMPQFGYDHHPDIYRYYPSYQVDMPRPHMDLTISRGLVSDRSSGDWSTFSSKMRSIEDEPMVVETMTRPGMGRMSSDIHSRLDSKPSSSVPKSNVMAVVPMGHRIVVSNLQTSVTQDDIRELFEDIGQLFVARLVRPGTAEVIYKNLKDAQKAVDTYHNRQLDGQPMKCLLVNNRPGNNPTAPAIKTTEGVRKGASSNKLVPDISTIHKVLFQRN
ncbi:PREDICTED: polymerase delta-interacting protein 3-like [Nicrophorus vespilloides]|uniref:Polymerase delta-interacting protein 3-like n=1 Tax=Nicrophorus vespilloides TaxID=110193 RepID=A0ABM1MUT4_NICVS|nr:PREDICTED: polymerase delta-interacting protein 3-like [Nicrophorus vespilloides]